ncbi:hypothetical protein [Acinetobacter indicus]|uniref:hypothetical protein n=1 Tax=Acinetobacter indicus TaxID=756892 RepID=UPI000CEB671E|nr:hypothetical protein [Acinetobacter indicus]AVH13521.1 hypothetical protein CTZ23_03950 [Acinetobacter indicus]NOJ68245.1 hypothetical protein [Acinetobacter indicus]
MKKTIMWALIGSALSMTNTSHALSVLEDAELSDVTGQALLNLEMQMGEDTRDALNNTYNQSNISFYKLGLSAEMELNANIKKLQLGCGGVNNSLISNTCDIDIDNISLSGLPASTDYTADQRAASSAIITNPFIQFAIRNGNSTATREILGFRISAEKIAGLMTLGTENSNVPNGINTFSGYMKTKTASGVAITEERNMTYAYTGMKIKGEVSGGLGSGNCGGLFNPCLDIAYESDQYNLKLSSTNAPFTIQSTVVSGTRLTDVKLKGAGTVGQINFEGPLTATVLGFLNLEKQVTGNITGLTTDITVSQDLGLIHALYLNNPASLSLQAENILWPGASVGANRGWWLALEDEVELGSLSPTTNVAISNAVLQQTINGINADLTNNPRACGNLLTGCIGGDALEVGNIPLTTDLDFPLTNLVLQGQEFKSNCYGGMKFC